MRFFLTFHIIAPYREIVLNHTRATFTIQITPIATRGIPVVVRRFVAITFFARRKNTDIGDFDTFFTKQKLDSVVLCSFVPHTCGNPLIDDFGFWMNGLCHLTKFADRGIFQTTFSYQHLFGNVFEKYHDSDIFLLITFVSDFITNKGR